MRMRKLGATGVNVSELGFGTCFMAAAGQEGVNRTVACAIDLGVNYFDTAADYGKGHDESLLGHALKGQRDRVILATKVGYTPDPRGHRDVDALMQQFEGSLKRLQTDHVDVIQVHEADFEKWWADVPMNAGAGLDHMGQWIDMERDYDFASAPVVEFLRRAKASGKARYIGLTAKNARRIARVLRDVKVDWMMLAHDYNVILRNTEQFLLPTIREQQLGLVIGAPLMKGWLARPERAWRVGEPAWMDEIFLTAYRRYTELCDRSGLPMVEVSLRWLLNRPEIGSVVVGASGVEEVKANAQAMSAGPLPRELQQQVDALGIVHPLIYQGRREL